MIDFLGSTGSVSVDLIILIPLGLAAVSLARGLIERLRVRRLTVRGQRVTANVVDSEPARGNEGQLVYLAVVQFRTLTGREVRVVLDDLSDDHLHRVGTSVDVIYDPDKPERAAPSAQTASPGSYFFGFAFFCTAFSFLMWLESLAARLT